MSEEELSGPTCLRFDITIMVPKPEPGKAAKTGVKIGYQKFYLPHCACCFKQYPEIRHIIISGTAFMCPACWQKGLKAIGEEDAKNSIGLEPQAAEGANGTGGGAAEP